MIDKTDAGRDVINAAAVEIDGGADAGLPRDALDLCLARGLGQGDLLIDLEFRANTVTPRPLSRKRLPSPAAAPLYAGEGGTRRSPRKLVKRWGGVRVVARRPGLDRAPQTSHIRALFLGIKRPL